MVPFVSGGDIESTTRIADVRAYEIAERTVSAEERTRRGDWCAADRIVATGAIRFAGSDVVADPGPILPRRIHEIPLKTTDVRRFIPDRVVHPLAEFDAIVASGVAHHDLVIAPHPGERIERRSRNLIRRIRFTDFDSANRGVG